MRKLLTLTAGACAFLLLAAPVAAGGDEDQAIADEAVLTLADLPDGWVEDDTPSEEAPLDQPECEAISKTRDKADTVPNAESPDFDDPNDPNGVATVSNDVFVYPKAKGAKKFLAAFNREGEECLTTLAEDAGFDFEILELDVADFGNGGVGYSIAVTSENGFVTYLDIVAARAGRAITTFEAENGEEPLPIGPDILATVVDRLEEAL